MTQYNGLNVNLSNSQLNKLKSRKETLLKSSNVTQDSNDEVNFLHKLFLTERQVSRLR